MPPRHFSPTHSPDDLRAIAWCQRWLMGFLLAQIGLWVAFSIATATDLTEEIDELFPIVIVMMFLIGILGGVFIFILGTHLWGAGLGIVLGILTIFPCIGLFVLLIVNVQATSVLRTHGIRVGLLGARASDLRNLDGEVGYVEDTDEDEGW